MALMNKLVLTIALSAVVPRLRAAKIPLNNPIARKQTAPPIATEKVAGTRSQR